MFADLALIAVATEAIIGYPDAVDRLVGHPVTWIGRLIAWCDEAWNSPTLSFETRRWRGLFTLVLLLAAAMDSRFEQHKLVSTPHLNVSYQPRDFRAMREMGASWKITS